jgi:hypothetical protein
MKKLESSQQVRKFPSQNVREEKFSGIILVTYGNNYVMMLQAWDFKSSLESMTKVFIDRMEAVSERERKSERSSEVGSCRRRGGGGGEK